LPRPPSGRSQASLSRIADAVAAGELRHRGEVVFAVESELPLPRCCVGAGPGRAAEAFARLRVWDTEANNGVLLYLLLADHGSRSSPTAVCAALRLANGRPSAGGWKRA
jgi:hypothetical protein